MKPARFVVASPPSPNPSSAGPESQLPSRKPGAVHVTPGSVPSSRYFQTEPVEIRLTCAETGIAAARNPSDKKRIHAFKQTTFILIQRFLELELAIIPQGAAQSRGRTNFINFPIVVQARLPNEHPG